VDERSKRVMGFDLGHSVQIEASLDLVKAALEALGVGAIDPGEMVEGERPNPLP